MWNYGLIALIGVSLLVSPMWAQDDEKEKSDLRKALEELVDTQETDKGVEPPKPPTAKPAKKSDTKTETPPVQPAPASKPAVTPKPETKPAPPIEPAAPKLEPKPVAKPVPAQQPKGVWIPTAPVKPVVDQTLCSREQAEAKAMSDFSSSHIIFIMDRSASMVGHWTWVQKDVRDFIGLLGQTPTFDQQFHLILLGMRNTTQSAPASAFVPATSGNTAAALNLLNRIKPAGNTDPVAAFNRAFDLIGDRPNCMICLFSDGGFVNSPALLKLLQTRNVGKKTKIYTFLYGGATFESPAVMQRIATENEGLFKNVTEID